MPLPPCSLPARHHSSENAPAVVLGQGAGWGNQAPLSVHGYSSSTAGSHQRSGCWVLHSGDMMREKISHCAERGLVWDKIRSRRSRSGFTYRVRAPILFFTSSWLCPLPQLPPRSPYNQGKAVMPCAFPLAAGGCSSPFPRPVSEALAGQMGHAHKGKNSLALAVPEETSVGQIVVGSERLSR